MGSGGVRQRSSGLAVHEAPTAASHPDPCLPLQAPTPPTHLPQGYVRREDAATTWVPMGAEIPVMSVNDHPTPSQGRRGDGSV